MLEEFILYRLIFAHLIADFPLQLNFVYKLKVEKREGLWLHILIHLAVMALCLLPVREYKGWFTLIFFITLCHYFSDRLKLLVHEEFQITNTSGLLSTILFLFDQLLHFIIIYASLSLVKDVPLNLEPKSILSYFYYSNSVIVILIFIILAIFFSPIFASISSKIFFNSIDNNGNKPAFEKKGLLYRLFITIFMLFPYTWILTLVLILLRTYFMNKEGAVKGVELYKYVINTVIPIAFGLICFFTGNSIEAYKDLLKLGL